MVRAREKTTPGFDSGKHTVYTFSFLFSDQKIVIKIIKTGGKGGGETFSWFLSKLRFFETDKRKINPMLI